MTTSSGALSRENSSVRQSLPADVVEVHLENEGVFGKIICYGFLITLIHRISYKYFAMPGTLELDASGAPFYVIHIFAPAIPVD